MDPNQPQTNIAPEANNLPNNSNSPNNNDTVSNFDNSTGQPNQVNPNVTNQPQPLQQNVYAPTNNNNTATNQLGQTAPANPQQTAQPNQLPPVAPQQQFTPQQNPTQLNNQQPQQNYATQPNMASPNKNKKILLIGIIFLVIIAIGATVFILLNKHSNSNGSLVSTIKKTKSVSTKPITNITVDATAIKGYDYSPSKLTQADRDVGVQGIILYTKKHKTNFKDPASFLNRTSVSYSWAQASNEDQQPTKKDKDLARKLQKSMKDSGITHKTISVPGTVIKGSDGKDYKMNCTGSQTNTPAQHSLPANSSKKYTCISKFNNGKQVVTLSVTCSGSDEKDIDNVFSSFTKNTTFVF